MAPKTEYVKIKDFLEMGNSMEKEAKKDRHDFSNMVTSKFATFDGKIDENSKGIALLSQNLAVANKTIEIMNSEIKSVDRKVDEGFKSVLTEMEKMRDDMDKKYASRWVEKLVTGTIVLILIGFAGYVGMSVTNTIRYQDGNVIGKK